MSSAPIYAANGKAAPIMATWEPPNNSPYFGFSSPIGPVSIQMDAIIALVPSTNETAMKEQTYVILLRGGPQIPIPAVDAMRLHKRMGWKERTGVEGVRE